MATEYGLTGELTSLVSERDQNFRVATSGGDRYVFKIANGNESAVTTDFQIKALLHLENRQCAFATPIVRLTLAGAESSNISDGDESNVCRVVSYVAGIPLSANEMSPKLATSFGKSAAALDIALADFTHAGDSPSLLWDLQRAADLRPLLQHVDDAALNAVLATCLDDFDMRVQPALSSLRKQVIHADLNSDNVLVEEDQQDTIAGVIDFGDMTRAPLVMEVAIAASYLRANDADALLLIRPFVTAFHRVLPLLDEELALLFDLIRARLAASITILRWRAATRGADDQYSSQNLLSERSAETFLQRLDALGRDAFAASVRDACRF